MDVIVFGYLLVAYIYNNYLLPHLSLMKKRVIEELRGFGQKFCGISEFSTTNWAQRYGC
jgi:hypothetical protein